MQQQASAARTLDELYKHQDALEAGLTKFCRLSADFRATVDERERYIQTCVQYSDLCETQYIQTCVKSYSDLRETVIQTCVKPLFRLA